MVRKKRGVALATLGLALVGSLIIALACGTAADTPTPPPRATAQPAPTAQPALTMAPEPTPTARPIPTPDTGPRYGGILRWSGTVTPDTLDPHLTAVSDIYEVGFATQGRLLQLDTNGASIPYMAESWIISPDGKTVTFELVEGIKFHDGTDFNAEAVAWNFGRIFDPDVPSPRRTEIKDFIDRVTADGPYTVSFHLPRPFRGLLPTLASERSSFIISPTAVQQMGEDFGRRPVGAGPFTVAEWVINDHITLEKNENYFEPGKPYLDGIRLISIADDAVRIAMLRTSEVDIIVKGRIRPDDVPILERNPNIRVTTIPGIATYGMLFNLSRPPYDNTALRQAMNYALNREDVVIGGFSGAGRPAYAMESQGWAHFPDLEIYKFNLAKAQEKMAEAGYNGEPLPLACLAGSRTLAICETYQAVWSDVGINIAIESVPRDRMWGPTNHSYKDVGFMSTWYTHRPDPYLRLSWIYQSDGWYNPDSAYNDPEMDRLLEEAAGEFDFTRAAQLYRQIQERGSEAALWVYAVWAEGYVGMDNKVMNYFTTANIGDRLHTIWLDQ